MTFWSVADCCRHLGIDPKTFHRWLAQAQLPLQPHPTDGRKQGLSEHHLRHLACLHHRSLAALPASEHPRPAPDTCAAVPTALLDLPEQLAALQAHLSTLQQQLVDLTCLLQQHAPPAALPAPTGSPPTPPASRSRAAAPVKPTPARQPAHVIPLVEATRDGHYVVVCPTHGLLSLQPDTPDWFAWLATVSSFRFIGTQGRFTAHRERERVPNGAWRAHRHRRNHTENLRLEPTAGLTIAVLEHAAATFQAHLM